MISARYVRFFETIGIEDIALIGGKNTSLGEMFRGLTQAGMLVPNGFAVTATAFREMLDRVGTWTQLRKALAGLDPGDVDDLARRAAAARRIIYEAQLPRRLIASTAAAIAGA